MEPGESVTLVADVVDPAFVEANDARVNAAVTTPGGKTLGVPMPTTSAARERVQAMIDAKYDQDFSQLLLLQAKASGIELKPENVEVGDGLS